MLTGALEDNILTMLCHSDEHAANLTLTLTPDLFSTRSYRKIADKAITYIHAYQRPPGVHLRDILEDDLRRGEDGKLLQRVLGDMDELAPNLQPKYVLSELASFISLRKLANALEEASEAIQAGDLAAAETAIYSRTLAPTTSSGIWLHDSDAMLGFLTQREEDFFPSGIEVLDQRGVRPQRKELFLIIGPKGRGKSWWACELGKQGILHRKKVLHVTLENNEEITAKRYTQALFAMTGNQTEQIRVPIFKKDQLGRCTSIDFEGRTAEGINLDTRGAVARKLRSLSRRAKLLIKEFPTGGLTIALLSAYLDNLERADKFIPDMMIVDSGNKMAVRGDHLRTDLGQIFIGLRGIAVARNMAVITTTHSNRSGDLSSTVTGAAHVGEDYSMLGTADTVCTISRTNAEKQMGLARILVDKARNVEDGWLAMISQNFPTGQFAIDSVYMNKHLAEEVNRFAGKEDEE